MREYTGWLFDLYAQRDGIVLWLAGEDHKPHSFTQSFPITFYVGGPFPRLRQLWKFLREKPVGLYRTQRRDAHEGMKDLLGVNVPVPSTFDELFSLSLEDPRRLLFSLNGILRQFDPDLILTSYGDTWLFTYLERISKRQVFPFIPTVTLLSLFIGKKSVSSIMARRIIAASRCISGRRHCCHANADCPKAKDFGPLSATKRRDPQDIQ